MSLYRNAWVFITGRSSTRTGAEAAALVSCLAVFDCADAVAAAARAGSSKLKSLREYFIRLGSFSSVCQYTPRAEALLASCYQTLDAIHIQFAEGAAQAFMRHRAAICEFHESSGVGLELGPGRQSRTVGITSLGEVGPILHDRGR